MLKHKMWFKFIEIIVSTEGLRGKRKKEQKKQKKQKNHGIVAVKSKYVWAARISQPLNR
jgi:hypothetical protein